MFIQKLTPRFGDIDGLRHINNTVIPVWFETARNPIFRFFVPELTVTHEKWNLIMAHTEFDFVGQLIYGTDVEVRTWIEKVGNSSFTTYHECWQDGTLGVKGRAVIVHFDFKAQKSVPIPEEIKAKLREHLLEQ